MENRAVEEGIKKARSFFYYGAVGVFQGDLSPLETFHGELTKRVLKLPKWTSNTAGNVVMGWPTVRARVVVQNLGFLHHFRVSQLRERESG